MANIATPAGEGLADETPLHAAVAPASPAYRRYVLWLLLFVYIVNFLDRAVINILAEPIKNDLQLADWQVGLLSGFAFGILYTLLAFPLARAADRGNRSLIIAGCLATWSAFTGACGLAQNYIQLLLARAGVGVGEAGCVPTSHALIADYTPKEKRASALAFYAMGTPLGSLLGLAMGGMLSDYFGWRRAFLVAAAPGLLLAVLCAFTLKEPRKQLSRMVEASQTNLASFGETFRYMRTKRAFWWLAAGAGVRAFLGYGHAPFVASYFYRAHGPQIAELADRFHMKPGGFVGLAIGIMTGVGGAFGSWLGGQIADRMGARDLRIFGSLPALAVVAAFPFTCAIYLSPNVGLALLLYVVPSTLATLWYGPVYASAQGMAPPHMRAMSASIMLFVINFAGLVIGAVAIGALSDALNKGLGLGPADGVRWALISSTAMGLVGALFFWFARNKVKDDMVS
jgi:predicted MFS family arabinose efflux permease